MSTTRHLLRALLALVVGAAALVAPVVPAGAVRVPETLAGNTPVGTTPVAPGFAIEYLGVLWEGDHGEAFARFRTGGEWGPWQEMGEDGAQAKDQFATALVPGGRADAYQVRVPGHARAARAVAINVHDGPAKTVAHRPASVAGAAIDYVTRSEWGADESLRFKDGVEVWPPAYYPAQKLTVHHTATKNDDPDPAATVRAIYRYHAVDKGWGDIGYQYLIDDAGNVYEGRSGTDGDVAHGTDGGVVTAAHVGGYNSGNAGAAILGDYRRTSPKPAAQSALERVLADLASRHGIDPQGTGDYVNPVNGATKTNLANIPGHRDWEATECPGGKLYDLLPTIRANVSSILGGGSSQPEAGLTLEAKGYKVKGSKTVDLTWTGATTVDVYRDGALIASGVSAQPYTDRIGSKGGGSYAYHVESGTLRSETVTVTF